ncbi:CSLREA domain-containing protein [Acinetobacter sp. IK40]|jgi:CSLREA domain-containing protein|uniref:CSLREA domain-containing protein n=1 Tax=Acinetobacter sp. IK40 TaxID=2928897 RepID=UPI002D1E81BB|nr:CSLREA domain-containing protein [Acinetobacter sp. IK40]MEB3790169.1 CSLREA domain-containing protein [Acinetobacter sp. IK40]
MKNYKKALLATMVMAAMPLLAATNGTAIKVTTFVDEDGENLNACSLREALKTAETRVSYGGCPVTDKLSSTTKVIQLEKGVYTLKKELSPNVSVSILGASPEDWEEKSVLLNDVVNQYPAQIPLQTTIKAENSRIFNTSIGTKNLSLTNLILTGGHSSDFGGAIYAGADVVLQSSQILDSQAKEGGAIFMAGPSSTLTISKSVIQGNQAEKGSVLSMGCMSDAKYIKNTIKLTANSFINNGSENSNSMFEFCGEVNTELNTNTIAKNSTNTTTGNLIKFTGDTKVGSEVNNRPSILSDISTLTLVSNTIVENKAFTTLLYDKLGYKTLGYNVIAYNGGSNSYACRYLFGNAVNEEKVKFAIGYNALALKEETSNSPVNNVCDVPKESLKDNKTNLNVSNISFSTLLDYQAASAHTAFMPMYYPRPNETEIKVEVDGKTTTKKIGLLDIEGTGCSPTDQRGLARIADGTLYYDPDARNRCDIGSVELMRFTAGDLEDLTNSSISNAMTNYQTQLDFFNELVKNPNNPDFLTYYKFRVDKYQKLLKYTKENFHYRAIYIDLRNYQLPLPQDVKQADGSYKLQFFDPELYTVTTESLGKGQINETVTDIDASDKENLVCRWDNNLQQIIFYRKDDSITQAGDKIFCKYTVTSKANPSIHSSGLIRAAFANIAPVASDTSITFKYKQKQKLSLNLLNFANDYGDTGEGGPGPEQNPNKSQFWKNQEGVELPIRLSNVPSKDLSITADRQGPCPEPDQKETCYGGNIYVQEVNAFNPFNFSFNYQVYDADGMSSNAATVRTINTATTTDDTRTASGGGGGGFGFYSLLGLFGLLTYRRLKK